MLTWPGPNKAVWRNGDRCVDMWVGSQGATHQSLNLNPELEPSLILIKANKAGEDMADTYSAI